MWLEYTMSPLGVAISDLRGIVPSHPNAARYLIQGTGTEYTLHIRDVRMGDAGRYQCSDVEGQRPGTIRGSAELVVLGKWMGYGDFSCLFILGHCLDRDHFLLGTRGNGVPTPLRKVCFSLHSNSRSGLQK